MSDVNVLELTWQDFVKGAAEGLIVDTANSIVVEREVIPIVFVPGVMGTRLKRSNDGKKVWDPDSLSFMGWTIGIKHFKAADRKELLVGKRFNGGYLKPLDDDAEHNEKFAAYEGAVERGWGTVVWRSYGPILKELQGRKWTEPIRHCFEFPVHAFGYNWSNTNAASGSRLAKQIDRIIKGYKKEGRVCSRVILVTHSMGGLVARYACKVRSAEGKVLGIVHGVQPATGSAAAYWRMKAGFERPSGTPSGFWDWLKTPKAKAGHDIVGKQVARILGANGKQVTMLLANMPGPLELLPNKLYTDNDGQTAWLAYIDMLKNDVELPKSNPYKEIYLHRERFYRLVEPDWLDEATASRESVRGQPKPWREFQKLLGKAEKFHDDLEDQLHANTVQFSAQGLATADKIRFGRTPHTWTERGKRVWREQIWGKKTGKAMTVAGRALEPWFWDPISMTTVPGWFVKGGIEDEYFSGYGGYRVEVDLDDVPVGDRDDDDDAPEYDPTFDMIIEMPNGSGDGTVPDSSSSFLKAKESIVFGDPEKHEGAEPLTWYEKGHEPIYKAAEVQHLTFSATENFCLDLIDEVIG